MGVPVTVLNRVAGYSPLSFCNIAVAPGAGAQPSASVEAIASGIPRSPLVFVFIACGPLQTPLLGGSGRRGNGCGADVERGLDHHAFGEYDVDHPACVDLDHGEYLLGEREPVVGGPVDRPADASAQPPSRALR